MSVITTHVLDIASGHPAPGVHVTLERRDAGSAWEIVGRGATDQDGRLRTLMAESHPATPGTYRLTFETGAYFGSRGIRSFYPQVTVTFDITEEEAHAHVPLLVSPYGYSTYRGS